MSGRGPRRRPRRREVARTQGRPQRARAAEPALVRWTGDRHDGRRPPRDPRRARTDVDPRPEAKQHPGATSPFIASTLLRIEIAWTAAWVSSKTAMKLSPTKLTRVPPPAATSARPSRSVVTNTVVDTKSSAINRLKPTMSPLSAALMTACLGSGIGPDDSQRARSPRSPSARSLATALDRRGGVRRRRPAHGSREPPRERLVTRLRGVVDRGDLLGPSPSSARSTGLVDVDGPTQPRPRTTSAPTQDAWAGGVRIPLRASRL